MPDGNKERVTTVTRPARRRLSRDERREQLLGAARRAFVEQGYHATAMDDIAERAGVSKPVLYQHFASKHDLYLGLVDEQSEHLVRSLEEAMHSTAENADRVAATMGAYFEFVDREDAGYRLLFASDQNADPEVEQRLAAMMEACAAAIATSIAEDTSLAPDEAQLLGVGLCGMAQAGAERWVVQGRPLPREQAAALLTQVVWRGLGAFPLARAEHSAPGAR